MPLHVVYFVGSVEAGSGTLFSVDVMDTHKGIKDPTVFTPPASCNNVPITVDYVINIINVIIKTTSH